MKANRKSTETQTKPTKSPAAPATKPPAKVNGWPEWRRAVAGRDAYVITVLAKTNPKRKGSGAYKRFGLYRPGMTVAEFIAAGGQLSDVAWDWGHDFISIKK